MHQHRSSISVERAPSSRRRSPKKTVSPNRRPPAQAAASRPGQRGKVGTTPKRRASLLAAFGRNRTPPHKLPAPGEDDPDETNKARQDRRKQSLVHQHRASISVERAPSTRGRREEGAGGQQGANRLAAARTEIPSSILPSADESRHRSQRPGARCPVPALPIVQHTNFAERKSIRQQERSEQLETGRGDDREAPPSSRRVRSQSKQRSQAAAASQPRTFRRLSQHILGANSIALFGGGRDKAAPEPATGFQDEDLFELDLGDDMPASEAQQLSSGFFDEDLLDLDIGGDEPAVPSALEGQLRQERVLI